MHHLARNRDVFPVYKSENLRRGWGWADQKLKRVIKGIVQMPLNTDRLQALTTSLGSLLQFLTTLLVKKCFLTSSITPPNSALNHSQASWHWVPGRRDQHLSPHVTSSGSCREQCGLSSASSSL